MTSAIIEVQISCYRCSKKEELIPAGNTRRLPGGGDINMNI